MTDAASSTNIDPDALRQRVDGRRLLLCLAGGIAVYKLCTVVSALAQAGAEVVVAMTPGATRFVAPLTFGALSGRAVLVDAWTPLEHHDPQHIAVARSVQAALVAPCTMDLLARLASGRADDIVTLLLAAIDRSRTPVLLAPSMNATMWDQPATRRNLATLRGDGYRIIEPAVGWQACRTEGAGRLPEPHELLAQLAAALA